MCVPARLLQSSLTLCDPIDCDPPGSSVHRILQATIPEWVAMPFFRGSSRPRDRAQVSRTSGGLFTTEPPGKHCFCFVLLLWPRGMWDLSSPTRDQTHTPCIGRGSLSYSTVREVPWIFFLFFKPLSWHHSRDDQCPLFPHPLWLHIPRWTQLLLGLYRLYVQSLSPPICLPYSLLLK